MLVLSRKVGDKIYIADNIVLTVVEMRHNYVRLGVEAPRDIPVHRGEVWDKIQDEKEQQRAADCKATTHSEEANGETAAKR